MTLILCGTICHSLSFVWNPGWSFQNTNTFLAKALPWLSLLCRIRFKYLQVLPKAQLIWTCLLSPKPPPIHFSQHTVRACMNAMVCCGETARSPTPPPWKIPVHGSAFSDLTSQLPSPSPAHSLLLQLLGPPANLFYWTETSQGQVFNYVHIPALFILWCLPIWLSSVSGHIGEAHIPAPLQLGEDICPRRVVKSNHKGTGSRECSYKTVEPCSAWVLRDGVEENLSPQPWCTLNTQHEKETLLSYQDMRVVCYCNIN